VNRDRPHERAEFELPLCHRPISVSVAADKEIGMARSDVMIRRAEDYFVFVPTRDTPVIFAFTVARGLE
jgi:hypothetical protein